uniref:mediator of RNA polymerase II transcription subunit 26 isoform X1 n=2 Tax=Myxine glutinosa TaxID=7769 RepID=UPI00358E7EBF
MSRTPQQLKDSLLAAIDKDAKIVNMPAVMEVLSALEHYPITKEALEETRLGKHINEVRKQTGDVELARRSKRLLRAWQRLVTPASGSPAPNPNVPSNLVTNPSLTLAASSAPCPVSSATNIVSNISANANFTSNVAPNPTPEPNGRLHRSPISLSPHQHNGLSVTPYRIQVPSPAPQSLALTPPQPLPVNLVKPNSGLKACQLANSNEDCQDQAEARCLKIVRPENACLLAKGKRQNLDDGKNKITNNTPRPGNGGHVPTSSHSMPSPVSSRMDCSAFPLSTTSKKCKNSSNISSRKRLKVQDCSIASSGSAAAVVCDGTTDLVTQLPQTVQPQSLPPPAKIKERKITFDPVTGLIVESTRLREVLDTEKDLSSSSSPPPAPSRSPPPSPGAVTDWREALSHNATVRGYLNRQRNALIGCDTTDVTEGTTLNVASGLARGIAQGPPPAPSGFRPGDSGCPITGQDLMRLHGDDIDSDGRWPGVNGCNDDQGSWYDWTACLTLDPHGQGGELVILPYVCLD